MVFVSVLLLLLAAAEISSMDVTVKTDDGYLIGFRRDVEFMGNVMPIAKFLGVPYAEPPVGIWRFRNPRPKAPTTEFLKVQDYGNRCLELYTPDGSEDCLYLNIFAPDRIDMMGSLAVMVYIHGGGFEIGSGQDYYSDLLAAVGNTIIVTVNYRLGVWGFLSTEDHNSHGNYGLRDQQLAIKWVHDNIVAFGGDINRITIFGESAGAASVIHQGLYPGNKGLFQRIIAQSGSASAVWATNPTPKKNADQLAKVTGCHNESVDTMVNCLRNLPVSNIQTAVQSLSNGYAPFFYPSIDNMFVTCKASDIFNLNENSGVYLKARQTFASFDLLIGINSKEGASALLAVNGVPDPETFLPNKTYFDKVIVPQMVHDIFKDTLNSSTLTAVTDLVTEMYTFTDDPENPNVIREQFIAMHGDADYLSPMQNTINAHAKLSSKMSYMYYLNVNPSFHASPTPSWVQGSNHGDDILFVFPSEIYPYNEQEGVLASQMVGMWTNFAKTGNPNSPTDVGVYWEPYTEARHLYLDITTDMTSENLKEGLLEIKSLFWNGVLPSTIGVRPEPCSYQSETSNAAALFNIIVPVSFASFLALIFIF